MAAGLARAQAHALIAEAACSSGESGGEPVPGPHGLLLQQAHQLDERPFSLKQQLGIFLVRIGLLHPPGLIISCELVRGYGVLHQYRP